MQPTAQIVKVQIPVEFKELFNPHWRIFAIYGGRGSLKSHTVARALLLRGRQKKTRILCTREIQKTIADSVHKLLKDIIAQYGFTDYEVTDKIIRNKVTGTEFLFAGLRLNTTEIKSMEGIDICWVEEAHSITNASLDVLTPTIRKPGSQIIFTYNRVTELDPVHVKYVINEYPKTCVINVNFDVAEKLGWFPDVLKLEMEADRQFPSIFAHKWLGEPMAQGEMAIIGRDNVLKAMQRSDVEDDGQEEYGADIARYGADRIVFAKRKGLVLKKLEDHQHLSVPEVCDALEAFMEFQKNEWVEVDKVNQWGEVVGKERTLIKGPLLKVDDTGVGGGVTDEMLKRDYNVVGVNFGGEPSDKDKYPNWISEAWFYMAEIMPTLQMKMNSDLLMELTTRNWKQDKKGKRRVESKDDYKKRGFRSPDLADAVIICYAPATSKPKQNVNRIG